MDAAGATFDRDALAAKHLPRVAGYARRKTSGRPDLTEECQDAATDALIWCLDHYRAERGVPFGAYLARFVHRAVRWAYAKARRREDNRPAVREVTPDDAAPCRPIHGPGSLDPDTIRQLPPDLRRAVELYCLDGHTLRSAASVEGVHHNTIRNRLTAAARRIGIGLTRPGATSGKKRLRRW